MIMMMMIMAMMPVPITKMTKTMLMMITKMMILTMMLMTTKTCCKHGLPLGVLGVGDGVPHHVLQEHPEHGSHL